MVSSRNGKRALFRMRERLPLDYAGSARPFSLRKSSAWKVHHINFHTHTHEHMERDTYVVYVRMYFVLATVFFGVIDSKWG